MSIFLCARCDELRDSDDGCEEYKRTQLICMDCMNDMEDAEQDQALNKDYDDILKTLLDAGCPEDIAYELAREKSR